MFYYELLYDMPSTMAHRAYKAGVYCKGLGGPNRRPMLAASSERIWRELDGEVVYIKHRNDLLPVDMKEFMFIKLTAKEIK